MSVLRNFRGSPVYPWEPEYNTHLKRQVKNLQYQVTLDGEQVNVLNMENFHTYVGFMGGCLAGPKFIMDFPGSEHHKKVGYLCRVSQLQGTSTTMISLYVQKDATTYSLQTLCID